MYDWQEQRYLFSVTNPTETSGRVAFPITVQFTRSALGFRDDDARARAGCAAVDVVEPVLAFADERDAQLIRARLRAPVIGSATIVR